MRLDTRLRPIVELVRLPLLYPRKPLAEGTRELQPARTVEILLRHPLRRLARFGHSGRSRALFERPPGLRFRFHAMTATGRLPLVCAGLRSGTVPLCPLQPPRSPRSGAASARVLLSVVGFPPPRRRAAWH